MTTNLRRVCVISFDFKEQKGVNQARKTRFFRELYGYTQPVKQQLKDGKIVERTYHYPGVLENFPYIKLGKSVLAVLPECESTIIRLFQTFDEVEFYSFIGWLPTTLWATKNEDDNVRVSNLIAIYGYHSILIKMQQYGQESLTYSTLLDTGFDTSFINRAVDYLTNNKLLIETEGTLKLTSKGQQIIDQLV